MGSSQMPFLNSYNVAQYRTIPRKLHGTHNNRYKLAENWRDSWVALLAGWQDDTWLH